jgi:primosomal replication protein N
MGFSMSDTNKVWLSGVAVSRPFLSRLPGKGLPFCWFELLVREDYVSKGQPSSRDMLIRVEALGQQSEKVFEKVHEGQRYEVHGYLRKGEDGEMLVRAFNVLPDLSAEGRAHEDGLRAALGVLMKSVDVKSAAESIRLLFNNPRR